MLLDTKRMLVQGQVTNTGQYKCPACKTTAYYDNEAYSIVQAQAMSSFARGSII